MCVTVFPRQSRTLVAFKMVFIDGSVSVRMYDEQKENPTWIKIGVTQVPRPLNAENITEYYVEPVRDRKHAYDYTSFLESQAYLTEDNLPFIMSTLSEPEPPLNHHLVPLVDNDRFDRWGRPFRYFPGLLPEHISYKVQGWRMAYWLRAGKYQDLDLQDIAARFDDKLFEEGGPCAWCPRLEKVRAPLQQRINNYANKFGMPILDRGEDKYTLAVKNRVLELREEHIRQDTAWSAHCEGGFQYVSQSNSQWDVQFMTVPLTPPPEIVEALLNHQNRFRLEAAEAADQPVARKKPGRKRKAQDRTDVDLAEETPPRRPTRPRRLAPRDINIPQGEDWITTAQLPVVEGRPDTPQAIAQPQTVLVDRSIAPLQHVSLGVAETPHPPAYTVDDFAILQQITDEELLAMDSLITDEDMLEFERFIENNYIGTPPAGTNHGFGEEAWFQEITRPFSMPDYTIGQEDVDSFFVDASDSNGYAWAV